MKTKNNHTPRDNKESIKMSSLIKRTFILLSCLISIKLLVSIECQQDEPIKSGKHEPNQHLRLLLLTVVDDPTSDTFVRFNQSVEAFGLDLNVLQPRDEKGQSFRLIQKALQVHRNEQDLLIMLVDNKDLIINGDKAAILDRFVAFNVNGSTARILFSADSNCWPDPSLESKYPPEPSNDPKKNGQRFLDSRALIGFAPALWDFVNIMSPIDDTRNTDHQFQLYSTRVYLNAEHRSSLAIQLDHRAQLFDSLHSTKNDVELEFNLDGVSVKNTAYLTRPVVVHGSGSSRVSFML